MIKKNTQIAGGKKSYYPVNSAIFKPAPSDLGCDPVTELDARGVQKEGVLEPSFCSPALSGDSPD